MWPDGLIICSIFGHLQTTKICTIVIKYSSIAGSMFGQILNNLQKLPKSLIFLQKWQNFGTSGHTACIRWIMGRLPPFIVNLLQSIFFNSRHDARFRYVKRKWSDVISAFVEILDARRQAVAVVDDLPRVHVVVHFRFGHCSKLFERSVLNCSKDQS